MIVQLDTSSAVPIFEQLRLQIARMIASGQLVPGSRLPAIRDLANDIGVARGTVNKVYDLLAREGLVEKSGRHGTVVLAPARNRTATSDLGDAADTLALVARQLGITTDDAHRALNEALQRLAAN